MKNSSLAVFTIGLLSILSPAAGDSIQAQESDRPGNAVTINTDLVVTWAQVFDSKNGRVVRGLEPDDFLLREDGKTQQIRSVLLKESQPLSVVLLPRALGCAIEPPEWPIPRVREALRQLGDNAEIALMSWHYDVALVQPLTKDRNAVADVIDKSNKLLGYSIFQKVCRVMEHPSEDIYTPTPDFRLSRPGEAIYQAAQYLEKAASPGRRKIIIVLAPPQWISKTHEHTAAEVTELLEKTGATVYALYEEYRSWGNNYSGAHEFYQDNRKDKKRRSGGLLEDFAEQTGGSILIGNGHKDTDELFMKLTDLIPSSYLIGYYPENSTFDGRFRRISLELSPRGKAKAGKVTIKTRAGYRAIRPSLPATSEPPQKR